MKKYLLFLFSNLLLLALLIPSNSFAQVADDIDPNPTGSECLTLTSTALRYKSKDVEVLPLQDFLQAQNYLKSEPTGYFGILTLKAVKDFQSANGINPTGYVGPVTKTKIKDISCNGGGLIKPERCVTGSQYINGKCIELPPECYPGFVYNPTTGIKCIENLNNVIIDGVSGPQTLKVGEVGTWTVKAHTKDGLGSLSYSVIWGDESNYSALASAGTFEDLSWKVGSQSVTFTHNYTKSAEYKPIFYVRSENIIRCITTPCPSNAGSAKTSISVKVGETSSNAKSSISVVSPNGREIWQHGSTQTIKWTSTNLSSALIGIRLYEKSGSPVVTLARNIPNTGSFDWVVPTTYVGSNYVIMVYPEIIDSASTVSDKSDAAFSIISSSSSATTPSITGIQGFNSATGVYNSNEATAGKYLVLYGKFASTGNKVVVGSTVYEAKPTITDANDKTPRITYQSTSQINVLLGSQVGNLQVLVINGSVKSYPVHEFKVVAGSVPIVTQFAPYINDESSTGKKGIQGFDAITNTYSDAQAVAGKYLVLYGNFSALGGNKVWIGSKEYTPTYQSATQINVLLGSDTGNLQVLVRNGNIKSNVLEFKVVAGSVLGASTSMPYGCTALTKYSSMTGVMCW
ncbi:MAG: peptidoglycan-binding domain-containing protein [Patescibacteria group bacterium]